MPLPNQKALAPVKRVGVALTVGVAPTHIAESRIVGFFCSPQLAILYPSPDAFLGDTKRSLLGHSRPGGFFHAPGDYGNWEPIN
jgi:hypothetical protein